MAVPAIAHDLRFSGPCLGLLAERKLSGHQDALGFLLSFYSVEYGSRPSSFPPGNACVLDGACCFIKSRVLGASDCLAD